MSTSSFETFSDWLEKRHKEKQKKCNQCDFASVGVNKLRRHFKTHSREKSNKCNRCDYTSDWPSYMKRHMLVHSEEKPQMQTTSTQCKLDSGEKGFNCPQCSYSCTRAGNLKQHMRIHSQETPADSFRRKAFQVLAMQLLLHKSF